jgi:anti-anti-sigma factor
MQANLKITVSDQNEGNQVISFDGEFDKAGHSEVSTELDEAVKAFDGTSLVFDFTRLKFINSEGIGYLMEIHTHLLKEDKKFVIVGLNAHVKDVFDTIGISEIIPIYVNLSDFLKK